MWCIKVKRLYSEKVFVLGKSGSTPTNWLYSGKMIVFGKKWLYSGKSDCIRGKWLYSAKSLYSGKVVVVWKK